MGADADDDDDDINDDDDIETDDDDDKVKNVEQNCNESVDAWSTCSDQRSTPSAMYSATRASR